MPEINNWGLFWSSCFGSAAAVYTLVAGVHSGGRLFTLWPESREGERKRSREERETHPRAPGPQFRLKSVPQWPDSFTQSPPESSPPASSAAGQGPGFVGRMSLWEPGPNHHICIHLQALFMQTSMLPHICCSALVDIKSLVQNNLFLGLLFFFFSIYIWVSTLNWYQVGHVFLPCSSYLLFDLRLHIHCRAFG